jgi:D-psicose/D-tagatose/L-ribulose 3-epimerase
MRFGICCGPKSLAVEGNLHASVARIMETLHEAGADYAEFGVNATMPDGGEAEFAELEAAVLASPLRVEAYNGFIPGKYRITGPDADIPPILDYCRTALSRCKRLGGESVVLGSAGARKVPEGFDKDEALRQFVQFCRELGPIAEAAGIVIAIEPLNTREDNLVLSVAQGAQIVDEVAHPHIQLLADLHHMTVDGERIENVGDAGARLRHTHVADLKRVPPGSSDEGEANFLGFFRECRRAGYNARCSFEGAFSDIRTQSGPLIMHLRQRWQESAA